MCWRQPLGMSGKKSLYSGQLIKLKFQKDRPLWVPRWASWGIVAAFVDFSSCGLWQYLVCMPPWGGDLSGLKGH